MEVLLHHNELHDLTADWLKEVCHNVAVEPPLLSLDGEAIAPTSANRSDEARADVHATGFWGRWQGAFFDIRFFHPNAHRAQPALFFRRRKVVWGQS